jgi:hypothetical protein
MHLKLLENVVDVILHGRHFNAQATRDVLVRQTLSEYAEDFQLARREMRRGSAQGLGGGELGKPTKQTSRHSG